MDIDRFLKEAPVLPGHNWQPFLSRLEHCERGQKEHLLRPGERESYLWFLEEGLIRFYLEKGEKERTFDFVFPGSFFCAFTSFLTGQPAPYFIQALTPCRLYRITKDDLEDLYREDVAGLAMGKWAAEQQFLKKSAREHSLLMESAEERYRSLLDRQPQLLHSIPLKYLASYIGITPQALSRIRRRIARN